jgi:hypothetical protein
MQGHAEATTPSEERYESGDQITASEAANLC